MIEGTGYALIDGEALETLQGYPDGSFDAVVCDPPHGIFEAASAWDKLIPSVVTWAEILRVTVPGGFLVALGHPRTAHRLACAIEDAGWLLGDAMGWVSGETKLQARNQLVPWKPIVLACKGLNALQREAACNDGRCAVDHHALLCWLTSLVAPPEGCVLDPFMAWGSTGMAALAGGFRFVGIERKPEAFEMARRRLAGLP